MSWFPAVCVLVAGIFAALWTRERQRGAVQRIWFHRALESLRHGETPVAGDEMSPLAEFPLEIPDELTRAWRETALRLHDEAGEQRRVQRDLEDVLASLQDAVLVVDGEARLRFLNAAALAMFAVRVEDVLGAQMLEALPSFGLESAVRAALHDGENTAREVALYGPRVREVLLRVAPVRRADGTVSGAVAIVQDLTELRRLERVRRDFVANASHELRTPIANIRATAETILDSPEDPKLAARFLPHLVSEAERLSRLVSDLLDLARADAGLETKRLRFDVGDVAHAVLWRLEAKAAENGVAVSCNAEENCLIDGDPASLEQVLFNLLDNALAYTPQGGTVEIVVRHAPGADALHPDAHGGEDEIEISVADSGIGIPAEELPRVFERFYRVDKARSRSQGGTGLGLAIVKNIVDNHGGHVRVESEAGKGTTFTVRLPAA